MHDTELHEALPPDAVAKKARLQLLLDGAANDREQACEALCIGAREQYGFVDDEIRARAWSLLLDVSDEDAELVVLRTKEQVEWRQDYTTVDVDVLRTTRQFPPDYTQEQREVLRQHVMEIIINVLEDDHQLSYYQGFHELALTLFLVLKDARKSYLALRALASAQLKDFLRQEMTRTLFMLEDISVIVSEEDPALFDFLQDAFVGNIFSLSWILTWFSHDFNFQLTRRLYDLFIASPPEMPIYLAAALVINASARIRKLECDQAVVHGFLSKDLITTADADDFPWQQMIDRAAELFQMYEPDYIVSEYSEWKQDRLKAWLKGKPPQPVNRRQAGLIERLSQPFALVTAGALLTVAVGAYLAYRTPMKLLQWQ